MEALNLKSVSMSFGKFTVLDDITIPVASGTFLGIVGPNGAGKSTLIKIMAGILSPTSGSSLLYGAKPIEYRRNHPIGYLPQQQKININFPLTVKDVIYLNLANRTKITKKAKLKMVDQALKNVGMLKSKDMIFSYLSGGQRQRVLIAGTIVTMPEIIFLDEPSTGIDVVNQDNFYGFLSHLAHTHGITVIMISHDVGVISNYIDKIAYLNRRLYIYGETKDIDMNKAIYNTYGKTGKIATYMNKNKTGFTCPFKDFE